MARITCQNILAAFLFSYFPSHELLSWTVNLLLCVRPAAFYPTVQWLSSVVRRAAVRWVAVVVQRRRRNRRVNNAMAMSVVCSVDSTNIGVYASRVFKVVFVIRLLRCVCVDATCSEDQRSTCLSAGTNDDIFARERRDPSRNWLDLLSGTRSIRIVTKI